MRRAIAAMLGVAVVAVASIHGQTDSRSLALVLDVESLRALPAPAAQIALAEVRAIWTPYGISIELKSPALTDAIGAPVLAVRFVNAAFDTIGEDQRASLGTMRFVDGHPEDIVWVHRGSIAALLATARVNGKDERDWPTALRHLLLGRLIGRVIAHEIGHYVFRSTGHARSGLMRAVHPVTDLIEVGRERFRLSAEEAMRIRCLE